MDESRRSLLLATMRVCLQHGFDCQDFVALMKESFETVISRPEQARSAELTRFLFASLRWAVPPDSEDMHRRRTHAADAWSDWLESEAQPRPEPRTQPLAGSGGPR